MYRTINDSLWSEPWMERLTKDARLLMVYLLTTPQQSACGVVEIGVGTLAFQTGLTADEASAALADLERAGKVIRWAERDLILVRRFFAWQRANSSHNYTVAARKQLARLPAVVAAAVVREHPELGEGYLPPGDMGHTPTEPIPIPSPSLGDKETATATATATGQSGADAPSAPAPPREESKRAPRQADELFDAMVAWMDVEPADLTAASRGKINAALRELRAVNATPDELTRRGAEYAARWPHLDRSPNGLAANWPKLARALPPKQPQTTGHARDRPAKPTAAENTEAGLRSMFAKLGVSLDADTPRENGHAHPGRVHGDVLDADYHVAPSGADTGDRRATGRALPGGAV